MRTRIILVFLLGCVPVLGNCGGVLSWNPSSDWGSLGVAKWNPLLQLARGDFGYCGYTEA